MDSKLKVATIVGSAGVVVLVLITVLVFNQEKFGGKRRKSTATTQYAEKLEESEGLGEKTFEGYRVGSDLSAFKEDASFFDKEETKYDKYVKKHNTLSLIATSVEKDLRIKIVDYDGKVIEGEEFEIEVEGKGSYKDSDKDGSIYIPYIKAGDYKVILKELEGYTVPEEPLEVNVKAQVEYKAIDDIKSLIKTEKQINPDKDNKNYSDMAADTDGTEITKLLTDKDNAKLGIDVSKYQGTIDWEKVAAAGVKFAIIRCGYRGYSTASLVIDPEFETNLKEATKNGIDVGVYFYSQAVTEVEAVEEASMVLNQIKRQFVPYPVFIDSEASGGDGRADKIDAEKRTKICKAFCETIQNGGYSAGIYASKTWFTKNLEADKLEDYIIWLAEYREVPTYEGVYNLWQYTSKGKVDGIEGDVDLNLSYIDVSQLSKNKAKNN